VSKSMKAQTFINVWEALEDSSEDAANMTMRSNVLAVINATVRRWNMTPAQAARRLGVTQPRLNDLLNGKINKFSLDTLLTLATRAGLKVKIDIRSRGLAAMSSYFRWWTTVAAGGTTNVDKP